MKKFLTLIAAFVACLSVNAADYDFDLTNLGSGWKSSYDADTQTITFEEGWTGRGWWFGTTSPLDLSAYDEIIVEYDGATTIGAQIVVEYADGETANSTYGANAGATKVSCPLSATGKVGGIKQVYIQCYAAGTLKLKRAYCPEVLSYQEAVDLTDQMDQWGQLMSSAFNGYSDNARVTFNYTASGIEEAEVKGWGVGTISSIGGGNVEAKSINAVGDGDCSVICTLKDLKAALNDGPSKYGTYGIVFNLWGAKTATTTRKSITIEEVNGYTGEGYQAPSAPEQITTNENGIASYVTKSALDFTNNTNITAYVCTATSSKTVTLAKATIVPANAAIVVKATDNTVTSHYVATTSESAPAEYKNLFSGSNEATYTVADADYVYALSTDGVFMQVASGVEIPAGKAYLKTESALAKALTLNFGDEATAINAVETVNAENGVAYNIAGQRVSRNAKGIVIMNGKKYINK